MNKLVCSTRVMTMVLVKNGVPVEKAAKDYREIVAEEKAKQEEGPRMGRRRKLVGIYEEVGEDVGKFANAYNETQEAGEPPLTLPKNKAKVSSLIRDAVYWKAMGIKPLPEQGDDSFGAVIAGDQSDDGNPDGGAPAA